MIKATPAKKKDNLGVQVEFAFPKWLDKSDINGILAIELSAILEAIDNQYGKQIILDATEMYINSIKPVE